MLSRKLFIPTLLCLFSFVGCSSVAVQTTINPDGSFVRHIKFTVGSEPMGGPPKLEKNFKKLSEKTWKVTTKTKDDNLIVEAHRKFEKGQKSEGDVNLMQKIEKKRSFGPPKPDEKAPKPKVLLTNTVTVTEISPGTWEYKEILHWKGQRDDMDWSKLNDKEELDKLKACLPKKLQSDENAKKLGHILLDTLVQTLFGPGMPMLPQFLLQTDLAIRKMMISLGDNVVIWLKKEFGDKLTDEERFECARKVIDDGGLQDALSDQKAKSQPKGPGGPAKKEKKEETDLIPMSFAVKVPGKIISSNGSIDRYSGTVYWGVYPQAAAYKDVVLRVVYKAK